MTSIRDQWLHPRRPRDQFPPYRLADRGIVADVEKRTASLERIYHKAHHNAWDGPAVLRSLIAKHYGEGGAIRIPDPLKRPLGRLFSTLLWGELAAWSISADLALALEDPEAKMAASSQVFDEARHFYVMREYLWRADVPIPPLGGYSRVLLVELLETDNLLHKLVGMQLLVENAAVNLFKAIASVNLEPVLTELLYYFERDEARHVGLGTLSLPAVLPSLSRWEAGRLWAFQFRLEMLMLLGGLAMREEFAALGIDQAAMQRRMFRLHADVHRRMRDGDGAEADRRAGRASKRGEGGESTRGRGRRNRRGDGGSTRGLLQVSRAGQKRLQAFFFPDTTGGAPSRLHELALSTLIRAASRGDRWLADRAPAT